ncbi:MAG: bifunctional shikimate kinase/3-dehydroquinate synthase, partial [Solirubrobacterales bacterium]
MAEVAKGGRGSGAIVFTGFMAAGKTTAARAAGEKLGVEVHDSDQVLEERLGMPIAQFFAGEGESEIRRREEEVVLELLERGGIVSLGGGSVESERVRSALVHHLCVWCCVNEPVAWSRSQDTGRPLAADRAEFSRRFERRLPLYEATAQAILPEGGTEMGAAAAPWLAAMRAAPATRLVWAESPGGSYPSVVGEGAVSLLAVAEPDPRRFAVADREALARHQGLLPPLAATIQIEGGEQRKTLTEAEVLLRALAAMEVRRDDLILAFGGGVTGDLAGFVAATYQRGTPVVQLPTTVVAQVDSAYGGKTGVDLPEAKNYVGAYHQPLAVLADPSTLATLPEAEIAAGFVEVLKTALIAGGDLWERVRGADLRALVRDGSEELTDIVFACARTKIEVVASDERDGGRRAVLNLGHTVGHAIESATGYGRYRHGEAVGLGLLAALRLSGQDALRDEVAGLLAAQALPARLEGADPAAVVAATARDKKRVDGAVPFVLVEAPGRVTPGHRLPDHEVLAAVAELA